MKIETANQLSGRAIGALFFAGFGALWIAPRALCSGTARRSLCLRTSADSGAACSGGAMPAPRRQALAARARRSGHGPRLRLDQCAAMGRRRHRRRHTCQAPSRRLCHVRHHRHRRPAHVSPGAALPLSAALRSGAVLVAWAAERFLFPSTSARHRRLSEPASSSGSAPWSRWRACAVSSARGDLLIASCRPADSAIGAALRILHCSLR